MSNVHALTPKIRHTLESKLQRMKELAISIKALEAEYDMIKKEVISEYFIENDVYMNSKGLVLATYKGAERLQFNSTKFKADFADIYADYSEKKLVYTFNLK